MSAKDYTTLGESNEIIDSRDLIEALADYDEQRDTLDIDEREEFDEYAQQVRDAADSSADWQYGATLIRDDYFTEYAQELAEDIGAIASDAQWPLYCIDWERAARDLKMDYTSVDLFGQTYWVR